jgi:hypothetical protein
VMAAAPSQSILRSTGCGRFFGMVKNPTMRGYKEPAETIQGKSLHLYLAGISVSQGREPTESRWPAHHQSANQDPPRPHRASDRREGHILGSTLWEAGAHDACSCGRRNGEASASQCTGKAEADDVLVGSDMLLGVYSPA